MPKKKPTSTGKNCKAQYKEPTSLHSATISLTVFANPLGFSWRVGYCAGLKRLRVFMRVVTE